MQVSSKVVTGIEVVQLVSSPATIVFAFKLMQRVLGGGRDNRQQQQQKESADKEQVDKAAPSVEVA